MFENYFIRRWERQGVRQTEVRRRLTRLEKLDNAVFVVLILVALGIVGFFGLRGSKELSDPMPPVEDSPWEFVQVVQDKDHDMNLNEDHELTESEVADYFKEHPPAKDMPPAAGQALLERLLIATHQAHALRERDANSDGVVTLAENYEYLKRFDKDGDGKLDESEHHKAEQSLRLLIPEKWNEMRAQTLQTKAE